MSKSADLRVCASCKWIFKRSEHPQDCPKCHFGSYGARFVFGEKAYAYAETQGPWLDDKMKAYRSKLQDEIRASRPVPAGTGRGRPPAGPRSRP